MSAEAAANYLDVISKLIETCRDGQAGYLEAAENTRNHELRAFYSAQAFERARFAAQLENLAGKLGQADPSRGSSFTGKLHRAWIDLKRKLGGRDAAVLASVEVGEQAAHRAYQQALKSSLPPEVQAIVERQAESISAAHGQVIALCSIYRQVAA